jgi:chromosome segregation ATPase
MFNKKRIQELEAEVQRLQNQLDREHVACKICAFKMRMYEITSVPRFSKYATVDESITCLFKQLEAAETALEKEQIRTQSMNKDNEALRGALAQIQEELKQGQGRLEHMEFIGRDLMDKLQKAQSEALSFRMENAGLKMEIEDLKDDADDVDEMLASLKATVQTQNEALLQKDAEISRLKNKCSIPSGDRKCTKCEKLEQRIKDIVTQNDQLWSMNAASQDKTFNRLTSERDAAIAANKAMIASNKQLSAYCSGLALDAMEAKRRQCVFPVNRSFCEHIEQLPKSPFACL